MAAAQATIRNFSAPQRGPGRSAPSLLEDLILFDPLHSVQPGFHLLEDGARNFAQAEHIGQLLPEGCCVHDFCLKERQSAPPALDEKPSPSTVWQVAAICQKCRIHLLLRLDYTVAWQDEPCPTWENPLHHLVRSTWRQDAAYRDLRTEDADNSDELHVYECSSNKCSAIVTVHLTPPVFPPDAIHVLVDRERLRKRTDAAFELKKGHTEGMKRPTPLDVLTDLRQYLRNAWKKEGRTEIMLDNKRFVVRFGPDGEACAEVLEMLGFELKPGESWLVPRPDLKEPVPLQKPENVFLDNIGNELDVLIANRPQEERIAAQDTTKLEPALREMSRCLSCQNYDKDPSARIVRKALLQRPRPFTILGVPDDVSDDLIIWAYQRQMALENDDPKETTKLMTALENVQRQRQSEKLSSQVAIERSMGRYGEQTISDAFRSLGLSTSSDIGDDVIIGNFEARLADAPAQEPQMRESLAAVGEYLKSQRLVDFARNTVSTYEDALSYFGADSQTDESFLASLCTSKISDNTSQRDMAKKAMQIIADHRNSESLRAFVTAGCQGDLQGAKLDIGEAFTLLGVEDRTMEADTLYTIFELRSEDDPGNKARLRKAIETIAEETNSADLKARLQMPGGQQQHLQPTTSITEPIGLDNIGNTCYLNSLLQSLFTIVAIRKIVLDFEQYKQPAGANIKDKRVGQRLISEQEVRSAQNFVVQLGELFRHMISSPSRAIRPAQELARLTLETGIVMQRRRSTIKSQQRPSLGVIDSRPILGPLPQSSSALDMAQPLQSPDAMDTSNPHATPPMPMTAVPQASITPGSHEHNANVIGLVSDTMSSGQSNLHASVSGASAVRQEKDKVDTQMGDVRESDLIPNLIGMEDEGVAPPNSASTNDWSQTITPETVEQDVMQTAGDENRSSTVSPNPPKQPEATGTTEIVSIKYDPPPGKPPPIPPRPQANAAATATATLESYARQQDVSEVLAHAVFQLSCAIRPRGFDKSGEQQDEVHDTFYGEEQTQVLSGSASPLPPVQFLFPFLQVSNEPKDLYAALDNYFDMIERGTSEVYVSITKLPPVLCLGLGRVVQEGQNQRKINCHVEIPNTIYMDRYTDAAKGSSLLERRKQSWEYKKELRKLQARIDQLEPKGKAPVDEDLKTALAAVQYLAEVSTTENLGGLTLEPETFHKMSELAEHIEEERTSHKARIEVLEQQIRDSFTDGAFRRQEYRLHAAFFHRGTVGSGHYWIYIFDHVHEVWRKYNDDHVTHVTNLKEIFGNPQDDRSNPNWNAYNPANPYFMVYVRTDHIDEIVETVKRVPVIPEVVVNQEYAAGYVGGGEHNLRPLGSDDKNSSDMDLSHHEYAGQPSQMSYLPPAGAPPSRDQVPLLERQPHQQEFNSGMEHQSQEAWHEKELTDAMNASLQPQDVEGGSWDQSQNTRVASHQW